MDIKIISTGGTFNKVYNETTGLFDIDSSALAARHIVELSRGNLQCQFLEIIHKDSNDFTDSDREELVGSIVNSTQKDLIVIHGTDTMDTSAHYLAVKIPDLQKRVLFVGSMKPYNVQKDEPIFNLSSAIGFLSSKDGCGIYIAMHGLVLPYQDIEKNREIGVFQKIS